MMQGITYGITESEANTEIAMLSMKNLLQRARKSYQKAAEAADAVYKALENMCIDAEAYGGNCDATMNEAISEYIVHGNRNLRKIMDDIREYYTEDCNGKF